MTDWTRDCYNCPHTKAGGVCDYTKVPLILIEDRRHCWFHLRMTRQDISGNLTDNFRRAICPKCGGEQVLYCEKFKKCMTLHEPCHLLGQKCSCECTDCRGEGFIWVELTALERLAKCAE